MRFKFEATHIGSAPISQNLGAEFSLVLCKSVVDNRKPKLPVVCAHMVTLESLKGARGDCASV